MLKQSQSTIIPSTFSYKSRFINVWCERNISPLTTLSPLQWEAKHSQHKHPEWKPSVTRSQQFTPPPPSHGNQILHLWVEGTTHIIMIGSRKIGSINKASSPARESICGSTTFNKWRCQRGVCHMSAEMRRRNLGKCWKNIWNGPLICTGLYHSRHFEVKAAVLLIILSMALFCSGAPETKAA